MIRSMLTAAALSVAACAPQVESVSSNLCQIDPHTGRCKVSEDTLLSRARRAVDDYAYQNYGAESGGVSCDQGTGPESDGGNGSDIGTFWCTKQFGDRTLYCGGSFTDGGIPDDLSCFVR